MSKYWEGMKVRLRAVEPEDAPAHFLFNQEEDSGLADRLYPPSSTRHTQQWATATATAGFENDAFFFQMEALDTGKLVGSISTHNCDPRVGTLQYGLNVLGDHRRKGYAADAICMVLRYYFQELRYQKANVGVYSFNEPSQMLHERLGFTLEGRQRRSAFTAGEHADLLLYGMTDDEFREQHPEYWR